MKEVDIDKLRWIRVITPNHIPKYLVEQIRDRDYSIEDFYKYQESICLVQNHNGISLNPLSHLYVLVNEDNITKGFLWFCVDELSKDIIINTFSVDKDYWFKGRCVKKLKDHILSIRDKAKLNKVYWITNYPKHSMRHGFKPSKSVLMEYSEEEENG